VRIDRLLLGAGLLAILAVPASAEAAVIATVNQNVAGGPTQMGHVNRTLNPASTCAAPDQPASVADEEDSFRYRNHTFLNRLTEAVCFTVDVNSACTQLYSAAYAGTFDPTNPVTRHVGDMGDQGPTLPPYSFMAAPGGQVSVVVHEVVENAPCTNYTVTFSSRGPWAHLFPPTISGDPSLGGVLTGGDADWIETPVVARRWRRCDTAGANCVDIPGATGPTYTVTDADLGHTIRFRNDATDAALVTNSSESDFVEPYLPFDARATESLGPGDRVHSGLFVRSAVRGRCGAPSSPGLILNPTASYLYDTFAVGSLLNEPVCLVARTSATCFGVTPSIYNPVFAPTSGLATNYAAHTGNGFGTPGAVSAILPAAESREVVVSHQQPTGTCNSYRLTLGADAPFATVRPSVSGTAVEGGTLTAGAGAWSGTPAIGFSWLRCDSAGAGCVPVPGATGPTYVPAAADVGGRMRVRVTATRGRSVSSDSEPSEVVAAGPPPAIDPSDPPPRGTVRLASRNLRQAVKKGRIPVRVTCSEACTAAIQLKIARKLAKRLKLKKRVIARGRRAVPAGRAVVLQAKLTRKARQALRNRRSVKFRIAATLTDSAAQRSSLARRAAMKRPARRGGRRS
jgi:hypothetical protein